MRLEGERLSLLLKPPHLVVESDRDNISAAQAAFFIVLINLIHIAEVIS